MTVRPPSPKIQPKTVMGTSALTSPMRSKPQLGRSMSMKVPGGKYTESLKECSEFQRFLWTISHNISVSAKNIVTNKF